MSDVFNELSNQMQAAIDTGNIEEVSKVLLDADRALDDGEISIVQHMELTVDAEAAGYDV